MTFLTFLGAFLSETNPTDYIGPVALIVSAFGLFVRQQRGIERLIDRERQRSHDLRNDVVTVRTDLAEERARCEALAERVYKLEEENRYLRTRVDELQQGLDDS